MLMSFKMVEPLGCVESFKGPWDCKKMNDSDLEHLLYSCQGNRSKGKGAILLIFKEII